MDRRTKLKLFLNNTSETKVSYKKHEFIELKGNIPDVLAAKKYLESQIWQRSL